MSKEEVQAFLSQWEVLSNQLKQGGLRQVAWIRWNHDGSEQPIKEGSTVIESQASNGVSYKAYIVCVKKDISRQSDDEDLTDAEEEIAMTPVIVKSLGSTNTVVEESDDGEESDDSVESIILASQDKKRQETVKTIKFNTSQRKQQLTSNSANLPSDKISKESNVSMENTFSIYNAETQALPPNFTDGSSHTEETPRVTEDHLTLISGTGEQSNSIHEAETQEIFQVPKPHKFPVETLNVCKEDDNNSSEITDSQLCDFDGFTENFEMEPSQSLFEAGGIPELPPISPPKTLQFDKVDEETVNHCESESKDIQDPTDEEMADLDDESTQIISFEADKENVSFDIHEVATQLPPLAAIKNNLPSNIHNLETQCVVKDDVLLNTSKDIYNALTQCITKQESDDDSTDIEGDLEEIGVDINESKTKEDIAKVAEDQDDTLISIGTDGVVDSKDTKNVVINEENDINMTQVVEAPQIHNDNITEANSNIHDVETQMIEVSDDVFNLATQVIVMEQKNSVPSLSKSDSNVNHGGEDDKDVYMASTQIITRSSVETFPSPIVKKVFLTSESFLGETSIETSKNFANSASKKDGFDNFHFSTPYKPISRKRKIENNDTKSGEVTITLKNIIPSSEMTDLNCSGDFYDNTQQVVADLMSSDEESTLEEKPSPGKENKCNEQNKKKNGSSKNISIHSKDVGIDFYKSTQDVVNDLMTQSDKNFFKPITNSVNLKTHVSNANNRLNKNLNDDFYNSTQEVVNDLLSQDNANLSKQTAMPTTLKMTALSNVNTLKVDPVAKDNLNDSAYNSTQDVMNDLLTQNNSTQISKTNTVKLPQSEESSEEIFKTPLKRKMKYTISDSELDSPRIDLFVSKMFASGGGQEVTSDSDTDEPPEKPLEEQNILFYRAVPKRKRKNDTAQTVANNARLVNLDKIKPAQSSSGDKGISVRGAQIKKLIIDPVEDSYGSDARRSSRLRKPNKKYEDGDDSPGIADNKDSEKTSRKQPIRERKNSTVHVKKGDESKQKSKKGKKINHREDPENELEKESIATRETASDDTRNVSDIDLNNVKTNTGVRKNRNKTSGSRKHPEKSDEITDKHSNIVSKPDEVTIKDVGKTRKVGKNKHFTDNDTSSSKSKPTSKTDFNKTAQVVVEKMGINAHKTGKQTSKTIKDDDKNDDSNKSRLKSGRRSKVNTSRDSSTSSKSLADNISVTSVESNSSRRLTRKKTSEILSNDDISKRSYAKSYKHCKVMFTFLETFMSTYEPLIKDLGGSIVDRDGDVLVAPQPCKRSIKIMIAAAKGIPIVSQQWLSACQCAGYFVDPWNYILKCNVLETKYEVSLENVLRSAKPYLNGWLVYITPKVPVPPDQLKDLVEICGGHAEIIPKNVSAGRFIKDLRGGSGTLSVSCKEDREMWKALPDPVVTAELILEGSFTHELKIDKYRLIR